MSRAAEMFAASGRAAPAPGRLRLAEMIARRPIINVRTFIAGQLVPGPQSESPHYCHMTSPPFIEWTRPVAKSALLKTLVDPPTPAFPLNSLFSQLTNESKI